MCAFWKYETSQSSKAKIRFAETLMSLGDKVLSSALLSGLSAPVFQTIMKDDTAFGIFVFLFGLGSVIGLYIKSWALRIYEKEFPDTAPVNPSLGAIRVNVTPSQFTLEIGENFCAIYKTPDSKTMGGS